MNYRYSLVHNTIFTIPSSGNVLRTCREIWERLPEDNYPKIPLKSLAKREELIFTEKGSNPVRLNQESSAILKLFQQIRDESHRFAKKQYQLQHSKSTLKE